MQAIAKHVRRAFGLLALSMVAGATQVHALPTSGYVTYYFSNATFTTEVGYTALSCNGGRQTVGRTSRYAATERFSCNSGGSFSQVACYVNGIYTLCPSSLCDSGLFDCN